MDPTELKKVYTYIYANLSYAELDKLVIDFRESERQPVPTDKFFEVWDTIERFYIKGLSGGEKYNFLVWFKSL